jgi:hypothetical protein
MTLDSEIARLVLRCEEAQAVLSGAIKNVESVRERWVKAWVDCAIVPESPAAMLTWLRRRGAIIEQAVRVREMRCELTSLGAVETVLASELSASLAPYGSVPQGGAADLLATAESVLKASADAAERRRTALALQQSQVAEISLTETKLAEARQFVCCMAAELGGGIDGCRPGTHCVARVRRSVPEQRTRDRRRPE